MTGVKEFFNRRPWVAFALVVVACVALAYVAVIRPGSGTPGADATPSPQPTVNPIQPPDIGPPPSAKPTPQKTYTGGDADEGLPGYIPVTPPPPFPTSTRSPSASDGPRADKLISTVIPLWATGDFTKDTSVSTWARSWSTMDGVSGSFRAQSQQRFNELFAGVLQSKASLVDAHVVKQQQLWNTGSQALWRVTVERKVVANTGGAVINPVDQVTWDLLITQSNMSSVLTNFSVPSDASLDPKTYILPGG